MFLGMCVAERILPMITKRLELRENDEHDRLREFFGIFIDENSARSRVKLHSELTWEPPADVVEVEGEIVVVVDIAGMNGKDINVVTDGKVLRISGTRKNVSSPGRKQFHKIEIRVGPFERIIELPSRVDPSKVTAHYSKGLLQIRIRKLDPSEYVKKVEIE
jgi:HSP20 family molecular chaperone IbpA